MRKVLCIDDTPIVLKTLRIFLQGQYDVTTCDNSAEGLERAMSGEFPVVITDIRMPGMTGLEIAEKVEEANVNCLIILLTSHAMDSYAEESAKNKKIFQYCLKPVKKQHLVHSIEQAFEIVA
jgi:YesN/AraC family two-component response regulator